MPGSRYYTHSYALVIGINSYQDPRFVTLGQAEADAAAFASIIAAPPYDFQVTALMGAKATRQTILAELFKLRHTEEHDRILVYFAGHGYTLVDNFKNETGFVAAADTIAEQDFTALELEEITELIRHAPAKHIAFIFDACFSGQALGLTRAAPVAAAKFRERRAYQVLSAGAGDQTVADYHSMTTYLVNELANRTTDSDGLVTFSEVGLRIQQAISEDTGMTQIPQFGHLKGSQGADLVFYLDVGPRVSAEIEEALDSSSVSIRTGAVNDLRALATGDDPGLAEAATRRLAAVAANDASSTLRESARAFLNEHLGEERAAELIADQAHPAFAAMPSHPATFADRLRLTGARITAALRQTPVWAWGIAGLMLIAVAAVVIFMASQGGPGTTGETGIVGLTGSTPTPEALPSLTIHPYCEMEDESPVYVSAGQPVTLQWTWTALESDLVQDHIDTARYEITLDGRTIEAQRRGDIVYNAAQGWYEVSWYADVGVLPPGEHTTSRGLSWSQMVSDGWDTYGPGGEFETEYDTCTIIVNEITRNYQWTPQIETIDGVLMAMVPAGCFPMGSNYGDDDEQPVTDICFDESFWIDVYEITIADYTGSGQDRHPVERVDWFEAKTYCDRRGARLPTEAEWEYAARGPSGFRYTWGNYFDEEMPIWQVAESREVGTIPDNASWVGAVDMLGNVYEWVHSTYTPYPYDPDDGREAEDGTARRVIRGGSWATREEASLRGSYRYYSAPDANYNGIGFRCARDH